MNPPIPRPYEGSSKTIEYVQWFAGEMEHKLSLNRHKGDREGWINDTPIALFYRIVDEMKELHAAIEAGDYQAMIAEAADVGNFAMMIADIARTLQSVKGPGEFAELPPMMVNPTGPNEAITQEQLMAKHVLEDCVKMIPPKVGDTEASRKSETVEPL